ncbi:hypothetical protein ACFL4X_02045 [Gemmatimonadota bacterium]
MRSASFRFVTCALTVVAFITADAAAGQTRQPVAPSFPGAEGYGASTVGGRGGRIIKVTNLNAVGPGSLQEAVSEQGPRIVEFDVSGIINGPVEIKHGRISIMGQTAPGAGICLRE